ncbi:MAG: efflux RND transporter periplasmic adaptor subunit [Sulfuricaulis sp.]
MFGGIFGFQVFKSIKIKQYMAAMRPPPAAVTAMKAEFRTWQPQINAVGSLRAVRGVDVSSEVAGMVQSLHFKSGEEVKAKQLLVQLNADSDNALLQSLEAAAELARTTYERDKLQYAAQAVSKATLDTDAADLKSKRAQVAQQAALVDKKSIRTPFAGRLGISSVSPGQYLAAGTMIVTLQSLDPILVDFYLPQQQLSRIAIGQAATITTDTYPGQTFIGRITAINPLVDSATRNIQVEAAIRNPKHKLLPGMYASITIEAGTKERYLTLPQTAVTFNPYGESIYIVQPGEKDAAGKPTQTAKQSFVTVGNTRGDQIAILKGVKEGDMVVTSGQLKLKNGSAVIINNKVLPSNDATPKPTDE